MALGFAGGLATGSVPARAQFGMMGMQAGMDGTISRRSVETYCKLLNLDKDQAETVRVLRDANKAANKTLRDEMSTKMRQLQEKAQEDQDWSVFQKEMPKITKEIQEKAETAEKQFFDDLKAILNPEQEERWARVERHRNRDKFMKFGFVSGMSADLVNALDTAKVDVAGNTELGNVVEQYEREMDSLLMNFKRIAEDVQKKAMDPDQGAMFDPGRVTDMLKPLNDEGVKIRNMNRDYARRMMAMVPEDKKAEFDLAVKRKSFPRIYKESHVQKCLNAAIGFGDLDEAQKDSLGSIKSQYERELQVRNDAWASATDEQEEKSGGKIGVMMSSWMGGGEGKEAVKEAKEARKQLDEATLDRLKGVLKEGQVSKLPEKDPAAQPGMDWTEEFGIEKEEED